MPYSLYIQEDMAMFVILFQCFDTIEQAYTYVDSEVIEDAIIFVHTGIYGYVFFLSVL